MNREKENAKAEYVSRTLARAHSKDWENYVITRIWHKLDRPDVKFVTQQYVVRPKGHALIDLYLPQLKMFIEVDEPPHRRQINRLRDEIREHDIVKRIAAHEERDIINLTDDKPFERIRISESEDDESPIINITKINEQCDKLIAKIARRIRKLGNDFKPWDNSEEDPRTYIKRGEISLADNVAFRTCKDAANCFGHRYKNFQRGITTHPYRKDTSIWFPKLYSHGEWENKISPDGTMIRERNTDEEKNRNQIKRWLDDPRNTRIVFAQGKDALGILRYRFKGVFKLDRKQTMKEQCAVWKKIADVVDTVSIEK
jgi:very-short-patch-repair endonuclease